jgi:hypothetical protein
MFTFENGLMGDEPPYVLLQTNLVNASASAAMRLVSVVNMKNGRVVIKSLYLSNRRLCLDPRAGGV